ncbi:excalibur calcium-binding domain-containing protein [Actinoplanes utahensis]|uniref:excalibur calcium-binding domain-containing protein n=1 Tax=Actinoplanes utahensis TaxID=1869 RepID=UPI000AFA7294|nr:excalibur calcium-binding domain-containing protein [Actinoplanes utahensis]GIF29631.1 hypothetical protein Aut01nite_26170 [Actinoplanes utahensis]
MTTVDRRKRRDFKIMAALVLVLCGCIAPAKFIGAVDADDKDTGAPVVTTTPPTDPVRTTAAAATDSTPTAVPTSSAPVLPSTPAPAVTTSKPKPAVTTTRPKPAVTTTKPKPKPTPTEEPTEEEEENVYYANCTAARNAGAAPLYRGQPGYRAKLDRDGDGVACE